MKKLLLLLFVVTSIAQAAPVDPTVVTITSPKVGQAPGVNRFAASPTSFYRMSWRTSTVGEATVNYLTSFSYGGSQMLTADSVYGATTYAEMQAKATALGITNLPTDPQAGH